MMHKVNLKPFNTFGIDAYADYFAEVRTGEELASLLSHPTSSSSKKFILGGGSNILFKDDFHGLVIKNAITGIQTIAEDDVSVTLKIGAGENWHAFVLYCIQNNWAGVENLSLIPGTVGAAPIQNIGAYGVELKDVFVELEAFHLDDGTQHIFNREDCAFGYRDSIFKNSHRNQYAILSVTLKLNKKPTFHIDYGNLKETLAAMKIKELSIKAISDAVIHIRQSKLPDPKVLGNAGSFFKNPIIPLSQFENLQKQKKSIPHFEAPEKNLIKISAGWLIEQLGFKGKRFGNIGIYDKQALIIVNYGKGTGKEIAALAHQIEEAVFAEFAIRLIPEVNFI